jgi:hypothetical protein
MIYTCISEICENIYHVHSGTAWDATSLAALNAVFAAWEVSDGKAMRHNATALFKVSSVDLTTQNGAFVDTPITPPTAGVQSAPAPNNVTIAIKWTTGLRGRSFRGRTFHIGMYEGAFSGNQLTSAAVADWTTRYGDLLAAVNAVSGHKMGVTSRKHNGTDRTTGVTTDILSASINVNLDSQRRRLPEHNRHR